jgi:hypothetical protein
MKLPMSAAARSLRPEPAPTVPWVIVGDGKRMGGLTERARIEGASVH